MSVYKEGFYAIQLIKSNSRQIYSDAADFGAPTRKGDQIWKIAKQLVDWYGVKNTRGEARYSTGTSVNHMVELIDECTGQEHTYVITYTSTRGNKLHDGYFNVGKVTK